MNIAWTIFVGLLVIVLQGMIFNKWGLKGIRYTRYFSDDAVFQGDTIEMIDEISNNKLLPVPWLRLESKMNPNLEFQANSEQQGIEVESDRFHRTLFSLLPFQKITKKHKLTCLRRGYYPLNTVAVSTGDMLGFGESFEAVQANASITVYPQMIQVENIPLPSHSWLGDITVRRWIIEDPFLYAGIREYSYGDSMNAVNWKATARTGNMQINKKDFTADHHLMIYVNFDSTEDIRMPIENEALIEKGLAYAASIANYTINNGLQTGFGCNAYFVEPFTNSTETVKPSVRISPNSSKQQLTYILDTIAKLKMDRSRNFKNFLQEDIESEITNTDILIITSIVTERMQAGINQLEVMGNAVEIIWLTDETNTEQFEAGEDK